MPEPVRYHRGHFPPAELNWPELIPMLSPAAAALARYDGMLEAIPNPELLLSPLGMFEALLSSRIEGTQATMGEVLEFEAEDEAERATAERRDDLQEVVNYRLAMRLAEKLLTSLPLSRRVILQIHAQLLAGVRGEDRARGRFRTVPNWIGPPGCPVEEAR